MASKTKRNDKGQIFLKATKGREIWRAMAAHVLKRHDIEVV